MSCISQNQHVNGWFPAVYELHVSKFPFVSRIEFIRSKPSNFSVRVSGACNSSCDCSATVTHHPSWLFQKSSRSDRPQQNRSLTARARETDPCRDVFHIAQARWLRERTDWQQAGERAAWSRPEGGRQAGVSGLPEGDAGGRPVPGAGPKRAPVQGLAAEQGAQQRRPRQGHPPGGEGVDQQPHVRPRSNTVPDRRRRRMDAVCARRQGVAFRRSRRQCRVRA